MTFIETLKEGQQVQSIYLAKHIQNAMTKTGKELTAKIFAV